VETERQGKRWLSGQMIDFAAIGHEGRHWVYEATVAPVIIPTRAMATNMRPIPWSACSMRWKPSTYQAVYAMPCKRSLAQCH